MLNRPAFYWHCHKSNFAQALASQAHRDNAHSSWELWAFYRLGMYASVANSRRLDTGWRGIFAMAVSLAACGRTAEAKAVAHEMLQRPSWSAHLVAMAGALAPFMPEFALELITGQNVSTGLHAALLLQTGERDAARLLLQQAFLREEEKQHSELNLYRANAESLSPIQQLVHLNAFLAHYQIPALALGDETMPLSPRNVRMAAPVPYVDGPLVSILMTTYQTSDWVDVAIDSILRQSYRNIELIIVDDASTDDTPDKIKAWVARDKRVKFMRLPHNGGTYVAKNIGLREAKGVFVTCHDSDDWSHPLKIERQVAPLLTDPGLVATTSHWVRMQDDGTYYARQGHPLLRINPSSPLFRREQVLQQAGIWDGVRTGADSEFLARLKLVFGRKAVKRIAQPLALGAHRADSLMTASSTGYSAGGISPQRLAYWEAWSHWHISMLRNKQKPQLPSDIQALLESARAFPLPEACEALRLKTIE